MIASSRTLLLLLWENFTALDSSLSSLSESSRITAIGGFLLLELPFEVVAGEGAVGVDFEESGCFAGRVAGVFPVCFAVEEEAVVLACVFFFAGWVSGVSATCLLFFFLGGGLIEESDDSESRFCITVGALEWAGVSLLFRSFENLDLDLSKWSPRPSSAAASLKLAR